MTLGERGIVFLALSFVALVLAIVATPLHMASVEQNINPYPIPGAPAGVFGNLHVKATYTMWKICTKTQLTRSGATLGGTDSCRTDFTCANDLARNARAFAIMSIVLLALGCCVVGVLDMLCKLPADPTGKIILIALGAMSIAFLVITWASQVALYTNDCTGQSVRDADGNKIGPSAVLFIIASGLMMIATAIAATLPGPVYDVATTAGTAKAVNPDGTVDAVRQNEPIAHHGKVVHPTTNEPVA
jgi:hypothetical protein